jgi:asparagine synthase (glutamine-hydrolysing)
MCGICGVVSAHSNAIDRDLIVRMTSTLAHRGPDDAGVEVMDGAGLGFRRLSILDLSPTGHQPMATPDRNAWITFNGEIYNFRELRTELELTGHIFRGSSDTEVLLSLYSEYGLDMFSRLNGMFAMAIFDRRRKAVLLARDRMGKKPLFYWYANRALAFASELKALRILPGFPTEIDPEALGLYLRMGFVPTDFCIHPGVFKLPPASYLLWEVGRPMPAPVPYWRLPHEEPDDNKAEAPWVDDIQHALWDATRIRLRSDVPVGVFLSSGIDSGLVAAAAAGQADRPIPSLTISLPGFAGDEWPQAAATARHLGLEPRHYEVREGRMDLLETLMPHFDEPFADSSALPMMLVCQAARRDVTVVLSGDGGDELFAGYENHRRAWRMRHLDKVPLWLRRVASHTLLELAPPDSKLRRLAKRLPYPAGTLGAGALVYPFEDWIMKYVSEPYRLSDERAAELLVRRPADPVNAVQQAQLTDLRLYLLDDVLVKVDRMSMFQSIEVRSPFLDYRVVELALRIPARVRMAGGRSKHLLRTLAMRHLPCAAVEAPKRGFAIPLRQWMLRAPKAAYCRELIRSLSVTDGFLTPDASDRLWRRVETNAAMTGALFRLLALAMWRAGVTARPATAPTNVGLDERIRRPSDVSFGRAPLRPQSATQS